MNARLSACIFLLLVTAGPVRAEGKFLLKGGETIVFFGDSITQNGGYVNYFEAFLLTRFPEKKFRILNRGISSETISGTSEPDHDPRRPWAHERFTRDVAALRPDVVVACFGMNDGNYHPFEPGRFEKYQEGVRRLIERTKTEAGAKLILMTPPPFDPYRRRASDPDAVTYGYKFPAIDYDDTLARYSEWLVSLRKEGRIVVDLHSKMNEHLRRRRERKVSYSFSPDAVHPDPTGHWLMAQHLLLALDAPATVADVKVDAAGMKVLSGNKVDLRGDRETIALTFECGLPLPQDPSWDDESTTLERIGERLNRYRVTVTGLSEKRYRLSALIAGLAMPGIEITVTREELVKGIDLAKYPDFPPNRMARKLLSLVKERRDLAYRGWRAAIGQPLGRAPYERKNAERIESIDAQIDDLRKPGTVSIQLVPVEETGSE